MAQLLAQHTERSSLLDRPTEKNVVRSEPQQSSEEDDAPIGLTYRQPSFSSLCRELVGKDGKVVAELPEIEEDPVIVLDDKSEKSDAAIGLTYRQPSFSSFDAGIGKGGEILRDIKPVRTIPIEEVPEIPEEPEAIEDESPEAAMQRELRHRNQERWKKMGYEPPTQAELEQTKKAAEQHTPPPKKYALTTLEEIKEDVEECPPSDEKIKPRHRRAGSNGMKLGEASTSLARMQEALMMASPEKPASNELGSIEENTSSSAVNADESDDEGSTTAEEIFAEEEEEEEEEGCEQSELSGNLASLMGTDRKSIVYTVVASGDASCVSPRDTAMVRQRISEMRLACIENLWIDETAYLGSILSSLGDRTATPKNDAEDSGVELARERAKASAEKYRRRIEQENAKLAYAIELLNDEYREAAAALDSEFQSEEKLQKYNRPSIELVEMKEQCRSLLRLGKIAEARRLGNRVQAQEKREARERTQKLQQKYLEADRRLKEDFAVRRDLLQRRHNHVINRLENDMARSQEKHKQRIAAIRRLPTGSDASGARCADAAPLPVRIPKRLRRRNDIRQIEELANGIAQGRPVSDIPIDQLNGQRR